MSTINEVYASNVLDRQIAERISFAEIEPTPDAIAEERASFLKWLNDREEKLGYNFSNQLDAWDAYDSTERRERILSAIEKVGNTQEDDLVYKTWEQEIIEILESLALSNAANYSETGGQL